MFLVNTLLVPDRAIQAQSDPVRLTRVGAQDRALERSTELARREAARLEARRLERASYPGNPEVAVEIEGTRAPWSSREYTRRLSIDQILDLRGERAARARVGRATTRLAEREYHERAQEIAAEVDEAYSRHLVAGRRVALFGPLRDRARNLRGKAESARRRETLTGFEARLLRSEALGLEADWLDARRELEVAESELRSWLDLPSEAALDLEDDLDDRPWRCEVDSVLALALQARSVVARKAAAESLALSRVALERRLGRVNPSVGASIGRERLELEPQGVGTGDEDTFVGLHLRVPLPLFGANVTEIAEARLEFERARAERAALDREVRREVLAACTALRRGEEQREVRREAAETASRDLELIEDAYGGGRIPLDEYLTLRERLVRQQVMLFDALAAVEEGRARLVRATGIRRAELARWLGGER